MLLDFIVKISSFHPAHGKQIQKGSEDSIANVILCSSVPAWAVVDGNFLHHTALQLYQRRKESVHARVELKTLGVFAPEGLQGTSDILDCFST